MQDNKAVGYLDGIVFAMSTIMIAYILFLSILPTQDMLIDNFITTLSLTDNQFYSASLADRLTTANRLGWQAPFVFIAVAFVYAIVKTIRRQKYTEYER